MTNAEWRRTRLKYVAASNKHVLSEATDGGYEFIYVDIGNVSQGSMNTDSEPMRFDSAPSRARRIANPGDSVVSTVRTYLRAVASVPPARDYPLVFSTGFAVLHPTSDVHGRYLAWYLQGDEFISRIEANSTGVSYPAISTSQLVSLGLLLPPLDEQVRIADFLDRETAQIDRLIAKQEDLIETLRERRAAVITTLATGRAGTHALTSSGDPFLGNTPSNWIVTRFRRAMSVSGGLVDPRDKPWSDMVLVAPNHVESGTGRITGRQTAEDQGADSGKSTVKSGQIIYSKIRPALNKATIATEDCLCSADMYALSQAPGVDTKFALYFMLSKPFHRYVTSVSMRVKMPKVNREELADAPWLIPPIDEQRQIVNEIESQTAAVDAVIGRAERFIEIAKERRAALITAAVAGQIDVREAA